MAATASATITIGSPNATAVTITPIPNLVAPVANGAMVATLVVAPTATWSGSFTLSGANASSFSVGPGGVSGGSGYQGSLLAAGSLAQGNYAVTVTASP